MDFSASCGEWDLQVICFAVGLGLIFLNAIDNGLAADDDETQIGRENALAGLWLLSLVILIVVQQ